MGLALVAGGCRADAAVEAIWRGPVDASLGKQAGPAQDPKCPGQTVAGDTLLDTLKVQVPRTVLAGADGWLLAGEAVTEAGDYEGWIARTDTSGKLVRGKTLGGPGWQRFVAAVPAGDGLALAGTTDHGTGGLKDGWLVRTDAQDQVLWQQTYGEGDDDDVAALAAAGTGFLLAGSTRNQGHTDAWLVRTDDIGQPTWQRTWGGPGDDEATALVADGLGGFLMAVTTRPGTDLPANAAIVRLDGLGTPVWQQILGGADEDVLQALAVLADGGVAAAGYTHSSGAGRSDVWLVRLGADGRVLWSRSYGGPEHDKASALLVLPGERLAVLGSTSTWSNGMADVFLLHVKPDGVLESWRAYGGAPQERGLALADLGQGRLVLAGALERPSGAAAAWLIRADRWGNAGCAAPDKCADKMLSACDDADPCTLDDCTAAEGCTHEPLTGGLACGTTCLGAICK
jgi:hypothetical protein